MKDLAEVLDKIPADQLTPPATAPSGEAAIATAKPAPMEFSDRDIEAYLGHLAQQQQRRADIAKPMDLQMMFRFCCVGLAGACLVTAGFIAWLYRPVDAMARAEVTRSMGEAVVAMSHEVAAAKPTRCPVIGTCKVEARQSAPVAPVTPVRVPMAPVEVTAEDIGVPIPSGTLSGPTAEEIQQAHGLIHRWSTSGANSIAIRDHIFKIANGQVHSPNFPHPSAFQTAYATYYGAAY